VIVADPGHKFFLDMLDSESGMTTLQFVKREGSGYPGNVGHCPGTNLQEVIRALISRLKYVSAQAVTLGDHTSNSDDNQCIGYLRLTLWTLESRAARKAGRSLPSLANLAFAIEDYPTCSSCGHILCVKEH
jgi:hypothetical protein